MFNFFINIIIVIIIVFERRLFCSPRLPFFDQNRVKTVILLQLVLFCNDNINNKM